MADSRHKHAAPPRKRTRRLTRSILPVIGAATLLSAGAAVVIDRQPTLPVTPDAKIAAAALVAKAPVTVSRGSERAPLPNESAADEKVEGHRFADADLDIHADAQKTSPVLSTVDRGDKVAITGVVEGDWAEIMHNGLPRWVRAEHLVKEMPLGTAPCPSGSGVESGLQPDTIKVHRAVCAAFPSIVRWGGRAGRGEHASGRAIDIMVSSDVGTQIAEFTRAHAAELGVSQVIWRQRIWTVQRSGDGWRAMSSRGGATANHMDHVHVTTYGNAAR